MASSAGIVHQTSPYNFNENPAITSKITVNLTEKGPTIDSSFYGSHINSFGTPPSPSNMKELGVGRLRLGGNEYDVFNWRNKLSFLNFGVRKVLGFEDVAKTLKSYHISGVYQINLLGFQPEQQGNKVVLKDSFNAKSAAELITTLNGKMKLNLMDFSLGNEFEQWHETHSHTKAFPADSGISANAYIRRYIEFALAMRQAQEKINGQPNSIKIWGPEISASWLDWNTGNMTTDCRWSPQVRGQVECSYGNGTFTHFIPYFLDSLNKAEKDRV